MKARSSTEYVENFIVYSYLLSISNQSSKSTSLIPYRLIRYMANNHIEKSVISILKLYSLDQTSITSCCNSYMLAMTIFIGKNRSAQSLDILKVVARNSFHYILESNRIDYEICNLFTGDLIRHFFNSAPKDYSMNELGKNAFSLLTSSLTAFDQYVNSLNLNKIEELLPSIKYDFNLPTLQALQNEINIKKENINPKQSCIYSIVIQNPYDDKQGCFIGHVFLIEQFFSNKNEIRYRIYQSWINAATMSDDFIKRGYGDNVEGTYDDDQIQEFLDKFKKLYSINISESKINSETVFGYKNSVKLNLVNGNQLTGDSIRYTSFLFNPKKCIMNLASFIVSNSELLEEFKSSMGHYPLKNLLINKTFNILDFSLGKKSNRQLHQLLLKEGIFRNNNAKKESYKLASTKCRTEYRDYLVEEHHLLSQPGCSL